MWEYGENNWENIQDFEDCCVGLCSFLSVGIYAALTYPRTIVSFPVSFTIGADVQRKEFDVPVLHSWVQLEVAINTGSALWTASILNHNGTLWTHNAAQGRQNYLHKRMDTNTQRTLQLHLRHSWTRNTISRNKSNLQRRILVKTRMYATLFFRVIRSVTSIVSQLFPSHDRLHL